MPASPNTTKLSKTNSIDSQHTKPATFYWHYAWVVVAIAVILQMVGSSIRMAFGVFIDPLSNTFEWDQGSITLAYAINNIVTALASPIAGRLGDHFGTRKAMAVGGTMFIVGMLITGVISQLWQFYLSYGVFLGIAQAIFLVPMVPGVMRWYRRQLGWAMGLLMASWGIGPAISFPLMSYMIIHLEWKFAFWITALGSAVIITLLIYLYKNSPSDMNLQPYGSVPGEVIGEPPETNKAKTSIFIGYMKKTAAYYNMSSIHFLGCVGHAIILVYLVPIAVREGLSPASAATILTVMAIISVPSRIFVPVLSDKFGVRTIMAIFFFLQGTTVIMLFWTHEYWMFYLFALLFGIGYGGESGGFPILNRKYFGYAPQGAPYGFQMFGASLGMALGGWIGGEIFDITGTYDIALMISVAASLAGMASIILLEPTDRLLIPDWESITNE